MPWSRSIRIFKFGKSEVSHRCSSRCVSPLSFDSQAVGEKVRLSHGGRLAEKTDNTFKNGLVFSNRPVRVQEKICLRIEKDSSIWDGALRVGFTTVPPLTRSLPLPSMSIPNLTDKSGHWAVPLDESVCQAGSELEFWVSSHGSIYIGVNNEEYEQLPGVDTKQPLWAMIDIYGQTRSILLLDSKKNKKLLYRRRSCPAPEPLASPDPDSHFRSVPDVSDFRREDCISCLDTKMPEDNVCVVCMAKEARITLPCGHRCLCKDCNFRVCEQFGTCPLCRHTISAPSVGERWFIEVS
uniref:E3 ubiquitin-protein ligase NEURL3-like n=1 Tax=Maylandia zebra TaxID=106582 RepID=UPI000D2F7E55|nr:E3 ubiquitin-protein ligase NEURL3-like [Maylandia zebra]